VGKAIGEEQTMRPPSKTVVAEILTGHVMHERLRPASNRFIYSVFCLRLNLDQLARADAQGGRWFAVHGLAQGKQKRFCPLSLRLADYGPQDGGDLAAWMRQILADSDIVADGEIWLQTFPRVLGYVFNPISLWFCHAADGALQAVLAEVNNTFGERHRYLLTAPNNGPITADSVLTCRKTLHVSPFCAVRGHYVFRFQQQDQSHSTVINYHDDLLTDDILIKTAIYGQSQAFTAANLRNALLSHPLMTLGVIARIHWQALRLWLKRVPFHRQPSAPRYDLTHNQANSNAQSTAPEETQ
jgi:DUF1365 family protein